MCILSVVNCFLDTLIPSTIFTKFILHGACNHSAIFALFHSLATSVIPMKQTFIVQNVWQFHKSIQCSIFWHKNWTIAVNVRKIILTILLVIRPGIFSNYSGIIFSSL